MRIFLVLFAALIVVSDGAAFEGAGAGKLKQIELWPGEVPGPEPKLEAERDMTKESENKVAGQRLIRLGNVSKPTITVYPARKGDTTEGDGRAGAGNGAAVLVCPGGGYNILAIDLEGTEVCERLNEMGFTAVLLKYRVGRRPEREKHEAPLQDAQRAMGLIRQNAKEWGIDPKRVGVLGFSAGGHLAAVLSTGARERTYPKMDAADELDFRPNFTVLIYPGYLAGEKGTLGELAPEFKIGKDTPQAFIAMSADDPVRVENALVYAAALQKEKIPYALHIYPTGGHGYGLRKTEEPVTTWPERLEEWVRARGISGK